MKKTIKEKKCKNCERTTKEFLKGLCPLCYKKEKQTKDKLKEAVKKERKKLNAISTDKVAIAMQSLARELKPEICVSCASTKMPMHGGHWRSRRYKSTIFYINNINPQCVNCNIYLKGNEYLHGKYIEYTFGPEEADRILTMSRKTYKFTKHELWDIYNSILECRRLLKEGASKESVLAYLQDYQHNSDWYKTLNNEN